MYTNRVYKDLKGKMFGKLTVLYFIRKTQHGKSVWKARCECGNEKEVIGSSMISGNTKSCGCIHHVAIIRALGKFKGKLSGTKWNRIKFNAKYRGYELLITQEQAAQLFEKQNGKCALSNIDLILNGPIQETTASLDRIDNTKGYTINNIQWIHKDINKMKNSSKQEDFLLWIKRIHTYTLKRKKNKT